MLDVIDAGGERTLKDRDNTGFHLCGCQAGIRPDDADDWDVDAREDINRRAEQNHRADQQQHQRQHDERVRARESKSYYPHWKILFRSVPATSDGGRDEKLMIRPPGIERITAGTSNANEPDRTAISNMGNHGYGSFPNRSEIIEQTALTRVIAEVATPAINVSAALISTSANNDATRLTPTIGMPVAKNQVATMNLKRSSPNPRPPIGNRKYSLSIFPLSIERLQYFPNAFSVSSTACFFETSPWRTQLKLHWPTLASARGCH